MPGRLQRSVLTVKPKKKPSKKPLDFSGQAGVDLHIHSTASDGTLTPREIVSMALDLKLAAIAITDHDTIDGTREALVHDIPPTGCCTSSRRPEAAATQKLLKNCKP